MQRSKRYAEYQKKLTKGSLYPVAEAVGLLKESPVKFDASVELHIRLGIDPKQSDQAVRGSVQLPHGTGKTKTIIAFVGPDREAEAKAAGADIIGTEEVINEIKTTGKTDFDVAIATPDMMKGIGQIARVLGQRGLMPNPKTETVGTDVTKMIEALKAGKVNYKSDTTGNVHLAVGKVSFDTDKLTDNVNAAIEAIRRSKPSSTKGIYMRSVTLCTTMGPGIGLATA